MFNVIVNFERGYPQLLYCTGGIVEWHNLQRYVNEYIYSVGQIKRCQLSFLLVTIILNASINVTIFGTYKLHKATSGAMSILS